MVFNTAHITTTLEELTMAGEQEQPVPIRNAATVVLVRESVNGPELFMLERNVKSEFVSGAYVFPGGAVDKHDSHQRLERICRGLTDTEASKATNMSSDGLGFWVAAIRECFEECGVLIANGNDGPISFEEEALAQRFSDYRDALNARQISFSQICIDEGLMLPVDSLTYFSRWLTPVGMPKRFDTCFYLCPMPANQVPLHDGHETVSGLWVTPEHALEKGEVGEIKLVPATIKTLEKLSGYQSVDQLVVGCTPTAPVQTICPEIIRNDSGKPVSVRLPLPEGEIEMPIGGPLLKSMGPIK